ncbi:ATP-binding protein [Arenicella sp.]|nr:ATP-binding protein [Arenicella sp.]
MSNTKFDDAYIKIIENKKVYQGSFEEGASIILRECAHALAVSRTSMWLLSDGQQKATCQLMYSADEERYESGAVIDAESFPNYFNSVLNSRVIDANDALTDPRTSELAPSYLDLLNIKSLLDATVRHLRADGLVQGVFCAEMVGVHRQWTSDEKLFAASIADLLSQKMVSSRLDSSEAQYQAIYESASDCILIFDDSGQFAGINPAGCQMFGASEDQLISMSPNQLSPEYQPSGELSIPKALRYVSNCLAGTVQHFDWRYIRVDGSEFDAEVILTAVKFSGMDALFAIVRDVTAKKAAERLERQNLKLELAKSDAEEAARLKMNFLANMSHEIRTPMNGIFGMVNLVLDTQMSSEQKDYIETIQSSTESLLTILNDVLEYSKLSSSQVVLESRSFNPRSLVTDVIRTFLVSASEKGLQLNYLVYPDVPESLIGDDHRIRQVLVNLVSNAIKFTSNGSVRLRVLYDNKGVNQHLIRFRIEDTGIGMDEQTLAGLFQPFMQADASITRKYGGTGLGLAICHDLVTAMGGEIIVESEVGKGSVFCLDLILQESDQKSLQVDKSDTQKSVPFFKSDAFDEQSFPNKPILIVEDNLINQKVTASVISKLGYPVTIANNGQEAVDLCEQNNYSIIFMDLSMPEMDGFEATEKIRSKEKGDSRVTIIAVTGHAFLEYRERCKEVGIDDFLSKPYNLFKLQEKLDYYTHSH